MMRIVLDTNVWLDWLVFHDASVAPLKAAVAEKRARIFNSAACEAELTRVLAYTLSGRTLDVDQQAAALAQCRALTTLIENGAGASASDELPRCADPDDQIFLELARDCAADMLLTKDKDLLVLAARKLRPLPFRIVTPREFARDFSSIRVAIPKTTGVFCPDA